MIYALCFMGGFIFAVFVMIAIYRIAVAAAIRGGLNW